MEKVATPSLVVSKAGVSIQKRIARLDCVRTTLDLSIKTLSAYPEADTKLGEQFLAFNSSSFPKPVLMEL